MSPCSSESLPFGKQLRIGLEGLAQVADAQPLVHKAAARSPRTSDCAAFGPPGPAESPDPAAFPSRRAPAADRRACCPRENRRASMPANSRPAGGSARSYSAVPCGTGTAARSARRGERTESNLRTIRRALPRTGTGPGRNRDRPCPPGGGTPCGRNSSRIVRAAASGVTPGPGAAIRNLARARGSFEA